MSFDYVMDSSAWIEYFGGSEKGNKIKSLIENKKIASSIIAISEIAYKFDSEKKSFFNFINFISTNSTILPLTIDISVNAGSIKTLFRKKTNKFSLIDAIHLATAQEHHSILLTTDNDFLQAKNAIVVS